MYQSRKSLSTLEDEGNASRGDTSCRSQTSSSAQEEAGDVENAQRRLGVVDGSVLDQPQRRRHRGGYRFDELILFQGAVSPLQSRRHEEMDLLVREARSRV